ncbi:polyprotein [Passiflora latent virus]|uniref:ORF1 protein n=1 Tax=Passiflora latent virus TaxID=379892 RepID=Q0QBU6_9VIRU|nr:polyprotein [Passiflora latent virus]ABE97935.1 polyprotein [Passiflora latent virus]
MALTYRSPIEEVLTYLEPAAQSLIATTATTSYQQNEKENFEWFNYSMTALAKEKLSNAGIYLSPYSGYVHSHPVCKTLENYILYKVLPGVINNSFYFVGIKQFKLNFLKKRSKHLDMLQCINRYVSSADKIRYGNEFVVRRSTESRALRRHSLVEQSDTLRDLIPNVPGYSNLFLHDELHYWSKEQLITFLEICKPQVMLGTLVYPTEIFAGSKNSLNPWCYEYEIKKGRLLYYPDGVRSEGYDQPLEGGFLLTANKIQLLDGTVYCVDIVCSKFSHHLVSITRGDFVVPSYRSFGPFEAVHSGPLKDISRAAGECFPVCYHTVLREYRYLRSLKKPDIQSAMAKFSQLSHEPSGAAIKFMEELSKLIIETGDVRTVIRPELVTTFFGNLGRALPAIIASKIKSTRSVCLDEFIGTLRPLSVDLKLITVTHATEIRVGLDECEAEEGVELVEMIDERWEGRGSALFERARSPYSSMVPLYDCPKRWKVACARTWLLKLYWKRYVSACFSEQVGFSMSVGEYVGAALNRAKMIGLAPLLLATRALGKRRGNRRDWPRPKPTLPYDCSVQCLLRLSANGAWIAFLEWHGHGERKVPNTPGRGMIRGGIRMTFFARIATFSKNCTLRMPIKQPLRAAQGPYHFQRILVFGETGEERKCSGEVIECLCNSHIPVNSLLHDGDCSVEFPSKLEGREVAWFSKGAVPYRCAGSELKSLGWPLWLTPWLELNGLPTKYDCMLAQKYVEGAETGFHRDDGTLFKVEESVLTVNLLGTAEFGIECKNGAVWRNLGHGDYFQMPAGFQGSHRHAVRNTSAGRISYTFRVLNELKSGEIGEACRPGGETKNEGGEQFEASIDGVKVTYRPLSRTRKYRIIGNSGGGDCFWLAMSYFTGINVLDMKESILSSTSQHDKRLREQMGLKAWAEDEAILATCKKLGYDIPMIDEAKSRDVVRANGGNTLLATLRFTGNHFEAIMPIEGCTIKALADCVKRQEKEVFSVLAHSMGREFLREVLEGKGVSLEQFATMCNTLDVRAVLELEEGTMLVNEVGRIEGYFSLLEGHAVFKKGKPLARHTQTNVHDKELALTDEELLPISTVSTRIEFKPSKVRAGLLSDCLHQGSTGVLCSELYNNRKPLMPEEPRLGAREIHVVLGTFGCGKSTLIRKVMCKARSKAIIYISPRKFLCDDFQRSIEEMKIEFGRKAGELFRSLTFEKASLQASKVIPGALVMLDEIQLFPPGFVSLLCCLLHEEVKLALFGDPCQSDYDSEKDRAVLGALESDIVDIIGDRSYNYNTTSRRFRGELFRGRLPCDHAEPPSTSSKLVIIEGLDNVDCTAESSKVCLVSSFEEKKIVQAYFGAKCKALTFGESTGANFDHGTILVTHISVHTNERRWVTVLSRFRESVVIVNAVGISTELLAKVYDGRSFGHFLKSSAKVEQLLPLLPGKPVFTHGFIANRFGADEGKREEKLQGDPWLKTMVDLLQIEDLSVVEEAKVVLESEWCKTHLPQCDLEGVRARWVHKILAKEFREKRMGYLVSEQFTHEHSKQLGKHLTNAAERFETIYPRHRASDTVTFIMAVRKRLRFSNPVKEAAKLNQAMPYGPFLLSEFLKRVPLKPMHDSRMMAEAKFDFEEKKTSKSAATIENHSNRSMKEWAIDIGLVFSKSQLCTKFDNRFRDAKAAQTIVCFQHAVLCRFAPYMRYIEKKLNEVLPEKYYIHSGKGLDELNEWVKRGGFGRVCTESDYEAFDASQDQFTVAFEISVMRYLGLPPSLIEDYKFIKTHLGSKLGSFAIMRFSGEASTFLFNTMANMLFTFLQYDLRGDERICFAGDDMCSNKKLHVSDKHSSFLKKLKLKAKVAHTDRPTFCGWNLSPDGIFKKPQLVLERLCIAKETNNLINCIDNYAIEVAFAYQMGERAKNYMTEEEVEAFYNCVRIIVKNKHLLKSDVLQVYQTDLVM